MTKSWLEQAAELCVQENGRHRGKGGHLGGLCMISNVDKGLKPVCEYLNEEITKEKVIKQPNQSFRTVHCYGCGCKKK